MRDVCSYLLGMGMVGFGCLLTAGCERDDSAKRQRTGHIPAPKVVATPAPPEPIDPPTLPPARPAWVLWGGGADPASNPISLGHDLDALAHTLADEGVVLFAGGRDTPMAVERPPGERPDDVRSVLAELLAPQGHAQLEYQPADFTIHGPANRERVLATLRMALSGREDDLLLFFAGHGEQAETPADNRLLLWGGGELRARELAELFDQGAPRRVRVVGTSCFSGGFAEVMFEGAEAPRIAAGGMRCGLFAAPWDDEASGCDPNPDRRAHESYALHFIRALQQPGRVADLDGDGAVGLLDAHTHAQRHARSFDVPTTTSERFVRLFAPSPAPDGPSLARARALLPEEAHLIDTLGEELGLRGEASAWQRVRALENQMGNLDSQLREVERRADAAYYALRIALLERWPLLEHPFRLDFDLLLKAEGPAIRQLARDSELALRYARVRDELEPLAERYDALRVKRARALRVARAFETLRLSQAMLDANAPSLMRLRALRACERATP